ncbi:MAG TPA: hypothetical protein PKC73_09900 [Dermatophilaceae bacterium]|nr:hypothetical protein [Dermatophilaceae bacterium]
MSSRDRSQIRAERMRVNAWQVLPPGHQLVNTQGTTSRGDHDSDRLVVVGDEDPLSISDAGKHRARVVT